MNNPSVSIIVPVYNVEPFVEDSIRSVMRQTYDGSIECIIVDDCGTDNSMAVVDRLVTDYNGPISFKVLHHDHNRGSSASRNTGMDAATGDYLFFLDSDDELINDCLKILIEPLNNEWYDVIVGNFDVIVENNEPNYQPRTLLLPNNSILKRESYFINYKKLPIAPWNKLYLTDFVKRNEFQFKEGVILEDVLWGFEIACKLETMYCVNQITYYYRRRKGSVMTSNRDRIIADCFLLSYIDSCKFVSEKGVKYTMVHDYLQENLFLVLMKYWNMEEEFVGPYKSMRKYYRPSILDMIKANRCCLKKYIRDFHYVLPTLIAPYWLYYFNYRFRLFLGCIKRRF